MNMAEPDGITALMIMESRIPTIKRFLQARGGIVVEPISSDELLRFKDGTQIGRILAVGDDVELKGAAVNLMFAIESGNNWRAAGWMGPRLHVAKPATKSEFDSIEQDRASGGYQRKRQAEVDALIARDGTLCFLCGCQLGNDITREHLVPRHLGGPDVLANMTLAHTACNQKLGQLAVMDKIRLREAYRTMEALRLTLGGKNEVALPLSIDDTIHVETRSTQ
jgi:hypothetical protein